MPFVVVLEELATSVVMACSRDARVFVCHAEKAVAGPETLLGGASRFGRVPRQVTVFMTSCQAYGPCGVAGTERTEIEFVVMAEAETTG